MRLCRRKKTSIWCDIGKTKMFVWFSTYDEKEILKSQIFNLILHMSKIFGEHKELRFLGWCANYTMEIDSAGVVFTFTNYLMHRNSDV